LAFLIDSGEVAELLVSVVALAIVQFGIEVLVERDLDAAEVAILGGVGA